MKNGSLHIVTHDDAWAIKREGEPDPLSVHATQKDAISAAEALGKDGVVTVMVHGRDGTFRAVRTFVADSESCSADRRRKAPTSLVAGALLATSVVAILVFRRRIA